MIGLHYADHAAESGMDIPSEPVIFCKWTSVIIGRDDDVIFPTASKDRLGRRILRRDWQRWVLYQRGRCDEHVAGFCISNDVSERDFQIKRAGTWDKRNGCDRFGPTGAVSRR